MGKNKKATSYRFLPECDERLVWLASRLGLNKTQVIERSIQELSEREGYKSSRIAVFISWASTDPEFAEEACKLLALIEQQRKAGYDDRRHHIEQGL